MAKTPKPVRKAKKELASSERKEMKVKGLKKSDYISKKQAKHLFGK